MQNTVILILSYSQVVENTRPLIEGLILERSCGVLLNFIFHKIVHKRNFISSQCHASVIHPSSLASFSHSSFCKLYTQLMHHARTCAASSSEVKKGRKYVGGKRGFVE